MLMRRLIGFSAPNPTRVRGFSLVELSIVLVIVGILAGSAIVPLNRSIKHSYYKRTNLQLSMVREAMHGYLISKGNLPCPVPLGSQANATSNKTNACSLQHGGLPAALLGIIGEQSSGGALLDAWGREYRYAVSMFDHKELGEVNAPDWLTVGEAAEVGAANLSSELQLCRQSSDTSCPIRDLIADQIVWIVLSQGERTKEGKQEAENSDADNVFVVSAFSSNSEQPFDDQLIWASRSELVYWLLKANWLP